eukprot:scaffold8178_cov94-Skeletonema_marinoi.AAC.1
MGHYKLWIAPCTALDTIWCSNVLLAAIPNLTSSGHLRRCSTVDTHIKSLSSGMFPSLLSLPTIMGHYKLRIAPCTALDTIWCSRVTGGHPKLDLIRSPTTL